MALQTFDYRTDVGSGLELEQNVKVAKFGNGYEAEVGEGLNPTQEVWTFSFFGMREVLLPAYQFLKLHTGKSFLWETPLGETLQFRASEIRMPSNGADAYTLSAKFRQSFTPN